MSARATPPQGQHLHLDCVSGAAGDMTLGMLLDLGVPLEVMAEAVAAMGLGSDRISAQSVVKGGIAAVDVKVDVSEADHSASGHDHHGHHYSDIRQRLMAADIDEPTRALAADILSRIARAEAKLHGTTVDEIHLHEVGAIDSIVDVVGAAAGISWLRPASVSCPAVAMGHGKVGCAHGALPVPSPAAVEILCEAGGVIEGGGLALELCTPTGAAILAAVVTEWADCPTMTPVATGYGAGDCELEDRPNVMRGIVGRRNRMAAGESVIVIEANIDDMTPEHAAFVADRVFDAGALDAWWCPIFMKKSRPAFQLGVVVRESEFDEVANTILRESTTLGLRYRRSGRRVLERERVEVETRYGVLAVVVARLEGEELRAVPEYEPCCQVARERGVPLPDVYAAARAAYRLNRQ